MATYTELRRMKVCSRQGMARRNAISMDKVEGGSAQRQNWPAAPEVNVHTLRARLKQVQSPQSNCPKA